MEKITYSIIAPIFNEVGNIQELYDRVKTTLSSHEGDWELLLVDDGSSDGSRELMASLAKQDQRVKPLLLARNFGHQIAVTAGLDQSKGDAVVIIDSDLQDPPEVISDLITKWTEGYEVVYAVREKREGETFFKLATAAIFYRMIHRITDVNIPMDTGDFRLMDRAVVNVLTSMRERHRFLRGMSVWVGFKQTGVTYSRAKRHTGSTKYPVKKMVKFAFDAITSFSYFPLQVATYLGFFCAGISTLAIPFVIITRLMGSQAFLGQATTLIAVLFLGGTQLISLGILGEYIGRLYDEAKGRPLYILREPRLHDVDTTNEEKEE